MTSDPTLEKTMALPENERETPRARDFFWRPWYAKAWWAGIPLYWLAMGEPTRPAFLDGFADSGYAIVTHILFIPITAIALLGARYFRALGDAGLLTEHPGRWDIGYGRRVVGHPHPSVDEMHPASPVYRYSITRQNERR